jgi:hypothetical protein
MDSSIGLVDRKSLSIVCIHCLEYVGELRNTEGLLRASSAWSRVCHVSYSDAKTRSTHLNQKARPMWSAKRSGREAEHAEA